MSIDSLEEFSKLCERVSNETSYLNKAQILADFFKCNAGDKPFQGDLLLWLRFLIPSDSQRVYNLQNKQMIKLFSRLFKQDCLLMHEDLELGGDISETLRKFFEKSVALKPQQKSLLSLQEVDEFLLQLSKRTKENEQCDLLQKICQRSTAMDLRSIIRVIKQDLRMNAKASHVLAAFGPTAYSVYQSSRNLEIIVKQFISNSATQSKKNNIVSPKSTKTETKNSKVGNRSSVQVMTPISPMLANACSSVEDAFKKCPQGMYCEIKYDGERVQVHKKDKEFRFFTRNLKPVMDHKVKRFREIIPQAFPDAGEMILDAEIILVDTVTGDLLPFGTLGAHKKTEHKNGAICLFVFDCILFQGRDLTNVSLKERRKLLEGNIKPIKSYVQLSESYFIERKEQLSVKVAEVLQAHLEGVVLKDPSGTYQPGKRNWIKIKKDYLLGGTMADSADLVVLGASYGTGKKGGILSVFLMGCYDKRTNQWKTVTKVHTGLDDKTRLDMHDYLMKLMERTRDKITPPWFQCQKSLVPDFVAKDPFKMPVWEITGAEFTKSNEHTASGISIRFPRITRLRDDKSAEQATDLENLQKLYNTSKDNVNVDLLLKGCKLKQEEDNSKALNTTTLLKNNGKRRSDTAIEEDNSIGITKKRIKKCKDESKNLSAKESDHSLNFSLESEKDFIALLESSLFNNITAYFIENNSLQENETLCKQFEANDGIITKDSTLANIVLHSKSNVSIDLEEYRKKYKPLCRHLDITWLQDSLQKMDLQPYPLYAVILKC